MENKKKIMIAVLSVLVCVMAVGYALLSQQLTINGTATIDSTWKVEITGIEVTGTTGDGASVSATPNVTSASFEATLVQPEDSVTYTVTIKNKGTLPAKVSSYSAVPGTNGNAIIYTVSGIAEGDTLAAGETKTFTVKVEYNPAITSQPANTDTTKALTVTINYVQDVEATNAAINAQNGG